MVLSTWCWMHRGKSIHSWSSTQSSLAPTLSRMHLTQGIMVMCTITKVRPLPPRGQAKDSSQGHLTWPREAIRLCFGFPHWWKFHEGLINMPERREPLHGASWECLFLQESLFQFSSTQQGGEKMSKSWKVGVFCWRCLWLPCSH